MNSIATVKTNNSVEKSVAIYPPCMVACPVHTDARRYIFLIAQERLKEALEVIMEKNPFPGVCGRICFHPCETSCRRGQVDEPLAICQLKRFVTDQVLDSYQPQKVKIDKREKVAIIGSGPAGLTAAADLVRSGYQAVVYEAQPEPGGMLRSGILDYRLPKQVLKRDIENILALGVELRTNTPIGKTITFNQLQDDYDAVLIAAGLSVSKKIPVPGSDLPRVYYAIPFLQAINYHQKIDIGEEVIVVGGGNVAIDVARSARRIGAKKVRMVCLESREEMPAHDWEVEQAMEEGIEIHCSWGPHQILSQAGKITGFEFKEVECVFDEQGRFNPSFKEEHRSVVKGDTIIFAIGQASELSFLKDTKVALNQRGQLVVDNSTMSTSQVGVFAAGEVATGPGAAIAAIASGHKAARAIISYFQTGKVLPIAEEELIAVAELPTTTRSLIQKSKRQKMPTKEAKERVADFSEVELGFSFDAAIREAQRCLNCTAGAQVIADKCVACLTCVRVCPYEVPKINGQLAFMDPVSCQSCGICATECPDRAIKVQMSLETELNELDLGKVSELELVGFCCTYGHIWSVDRIAAAERKFAAQVKLFRVPCTGRLEINQLLSVFEKGAKRVLVTVCAQDYCHFNSGADRIIRKVNWLREFLPAVGIEADRLILEEIKGDTSLQFLVSQILGEKLEVTK